MSAHNHQDSRITTFISHYVMKENKTKTWHHKKSLNLFKTHFSGTKLNFKVLRTPAKQKFKIFISSK